MTDIEWMTYRAAAIMLGGHGPVLRALITGRIRSQGRALDSTTLEDISADLWAEWSFLPTFKGPVSEQRRAQGWLVPPGTEFRRVGYGFNEFRLLRADVDRLASPTTIEPAVATGAPQPVADIATANPRQSIDFDALLAFIKNHYATARSLSERTNRDKAKASAEEHFRRLIPAEAWRNAFTKAEINNNNGRPRTRPRNP